MTISKEIATDQQTFMKNDTNSIYDQTPIIMVDRGYCSFVSKTRNIQNAGGKVALIINHDQQFDDIYALEDDGSGTDINISTILIPEEEGHHLKVFFTKYQDDPDVLNQVILHIDHKFKTLAQTVALKMFFNPMDYKVYDFINGVMQLELGTKILEDKRFQFNPIYSFNVDFESKEEVSSLIERGRCMCNGRYCENYNLLEGKGHNILSEAIRQKCIYILTKDNNRTKYFDYMSKFYSQCANNLNVTFACSDNVLSSVDKELPSQVYECFLKSFVSTNSNFHDEEELFQKCDKNIHLEESFYFMINKKMKKALPLLLINDEMFYGKWKTENILGDMCAAFENKPEICDKIIALVENSNISLSGGLKHIHILIIIIVGIILINVVIFIFLRRYALKKLQNSIESNETATIIDRKVRESLNNDENFVLKNNKSTVTENELVKL
jgi:hypothetical protein